MESKNKSITVICPFNNSLPQSVRGHYRVIEMHPSLTHSDQMLAFYIPRNGLSTPWSSFFFLFRLQRCSYFDP